jgi:hypothetical protein
MTTYSGGCHCGRIKLTFWTNQYAQTHAQLCQKAFAGFQRGWEEDPGLRIDPFLDPLRDDRRFTDLMRIVAFAS